MICKSRKSFEFYLSWMGAKRCFSISEELGLIDEVSGTIWLNGGLGVPVADGRASDSLLGTFIWDKKEDQCPDALGPDLQRRGGYFC
jgi:hypothetical protein